MMQADQNRLARLELFRYRNNAPQKRPVILTVGPRQTAKLAVWCAKERTVTKMENMQLRLSALAAERDIMKLALTPQTCMRKKPDRNITLNH